MTQSTPRNVATPKSSPSLAEEEQDRLASLIGEKTVSNYDAVLEQDELTEAIRRGAEACVIVMLECEPALVEWRDR